MRLKFYQCTENILTETLLQQHKLFPHQCQRWKTLLMPTLQKLRAVIRVRLFVTLLLPPVFFFHLALTIAAVTKQN